MSDVWRGFSGYEGIRHVSDLNQIKVLTGQRVATKGVRFEKDTPERILKPPISATIKNGEVILHG